MLTCCVAMQVCKYIDMPLQHISNLTLLAMNRPPQKHTEDLLDKLRARIPGLALRTTFICGFPGVRPPCCSCITHCTPDGAGNSTTHVLAITTHVVLLGCIDASWALCNKTKSRAAAGIYKTTPCCTTPNSCRRQQNSTRSCMTFARSSSLREWVPLHIAVRRALLQLHYQSRCAQRHSLCRRPPTITC